MVKKEEIKKTVENLRKVTKKRNFSQAVDLIINVKNVDIKKTPIDQFITLPHTFTKKPKVCAILDDDFVKKAQQIADHVVSKSELERISNAREIKKLGKNYDFFVSQANMMGLIATKFGRILGPLGKMPNPKFGGVVAPSTDIASVVDKFKKSIRVMSKNEYIVKTRVGYENMKDEEITDNTMHVYETITHALPHGEHNVKSAIMKFTMSRPLIIGETIEESALKNGK